MGHRQTRTDLILTTTYLLHTFCFSSRFLCLQHNNNHRPQYPTPPPTLAVVQKKGHPLVDGVATAVATGIILSIVVAAAVVSFGLCSTASPPFGTTNPFIVPFVTVLLTGCSRVPGLSVPFVA
jgi:hypothetical protein